MGGGYEGHLDVCCSLGSRLERFERTESMSRDSICSGSKKYRLHRMYGVCTPYMHTPALLRLHVQAGTRDRTPLNQLRKSVHT